MIESYSNRFSRLRALVFTHTDRSILGYMTVIDVIFMSPSSGWPVAPFLKIHMTPWHMTTVIYVYWGPYYRQHKRSDSPWRKHLVPPPIHPARISGIIDFTRSAQRIWWWSIWSMTDKCCLRGWEASLQWDHKVKGSSDTNSPGHRTSGHLCSHLLKPLHCTVRVETAVLGKTQQHWYCLTTSP